MGLHVPSQSKYLIEFKYEDNRWYKKYKDGWIEQGGINRTSFLIPFKKNIVTFNFTPIYSGYGRNGSVARATNVNLKGFGISTDAFELFIPTTSYSYYATGY